MSIRYHTWFDGLAFIAITANTRNIKEFSKPQIIINAWTKGDAVDLDPLMADSDVTFDHPLKYILIVAPLDTVRNLVEKVKLVLLWERNTEREEFG